MSPTHRAAPLRQCRANARHKPPCAAPGPPHLEAPVSCSNIAACPNPLPRLLRRPRTTLRAFSHCRMPITLTAAVCCRCAFKHAANVRFRVEIGHHKLTPPCPLVTRSSIRPPDKLVRARPQTQLKTNL